VRAAFAARFVFTWLARSPYPFMMIRSLFVSLLALSIAVAAPAAAQVRPAETPSHAAYEQAHAAYVRAATAYWEDVAAKRRGRIAKRRQHEPITLADYVLTQPPVYTGPPRPPDLAPPPEPLVEQEPIPVVADFLQAAADEFGFVPDLPKSESEFKRAYVKAALAAGLTREQIVGVYAFETGGRGTYDMQAGVTPTRTRAISPALGYNQLLSTNTVSLLAEYGDHYLAVLQGKAQKLGPEARQPFERKLAALRKMIAYCRSVPPQWSAYDTLAKKTRGGWGAHAAVLDIDIGPMLQVQKLLDSVRFAKSKGYTAPLSAAELELMNLTGDGNGIDLVTMPQTLRDRVPTANFFQPNGYARNPIAKRTGTVANLFAELETIIAREIRSPGAQEMAAAF
jgi:hypothetical protein